jgi:hypothetical protein
VIVSGIMGLPSPVATELRAPAAGMPELPALAHSCFYIGSDNMVQVADPPVRLKDFLDQFPQRSTFSSICQQDLSGGLQQVGDLVRGALTGDPCLESKLADVDPKMSGAQYDCTVSAVTYSDTAVQPVMDLPRCTPEADTATNQPCWHLSADPDSCPQIDHLALRIEGRDHLPMAAHIIASCVTDEPTL